MVSGVGTNALEPVHESLKSTIAKSAALEVSKGKQPLSTSRGLKAVSMATGIGIGVGEKQKGSSISSKAKDKLAEASKKSPFVAPNDDNINEETKGEMAGRKGTKGRGNGKGK